ncbi:hypothetical protein TWF506_001588 [Arthrobotrys conoides]|uniref:Uncharacterized protein n=1 Tax=Arthrobotrys conoides TaxID=74498 RepID=A0AAN8PS26_9PEZI
MAAYFLRNPVVYHLLFWFLGLFPSNVWPTPLENLGPSNIVFAESDGNHESATNQRAAQKKTDIRGNMTSILRDPAITNSTDIIQWNTSISAPEPLKGKDIQDLNQTSDIRDIKDPQQGISTSSIKESRYFPPSSLYGFKVVCPSLLEIIGGGTDFERRMNQDPTAYRTFQSHPKTRPSTEENLESAGILFKILRGVCIACAECDPRTGQLKTVPPGSCRSADTVGRCSNWLNCRCEVEMRDFIDREDISDAETLDLYRTLDNIPNWIKRKFPNHRFSTPDGVSLAWQRDGWGRPHPLPVGVIRGGQIFDPADSDGPQYAPDTAEPFPLYGPEPPDSWTNYHWLAGNGPGIWGMDIGGSSSSSSGSSSGSGSHPKRDNIGGAGGADTTKVIR